MKRLITAVILILVLGTDVIAETYKIDPDHSTVGFKIKHLTISSVPGRFTQFNGTFSFDPKNVGASSANATIKVGSINTENEKRDKHLRGADFFHTEAHPSMSFKTTKIEPVSSEEFKAHGQLTISGVTKPVTLDVEYGGSVKDPWGNQRAAFAATAKINRKDFGLKWNKVLETGGLVVGDDVKITIEIEGIQQG